jgi:hypothetical protein
LERQTWDDGLRRPCCCCCCCCCCWRRAALLPTRRAPLLHGACGWRCAGRVGEVGVWRVQG